MKTRHQLNEEIISSLITKVVALEHEIEEKEAVIIMMEHDQQKLVEIVNSIAREAVI